MKAETILDTIGRTPHLKIQRLFRSDIEVWFKLERANPCGSIKDRIALSMIETAEKDGSLQPGMTILEPTSGNTGIGLAMVAAVKGYRLLLVMPESMSVERRRLMSSFGAEMVLTPKEKGIPGAIEKAEEILASNKEMWMPQQFENPANIAVHREKTAAEILEDFPHGIDALITGVGTGGHLTGCAETLKGKFPKLQVFAVEPEESPVISGGEPGPHAIQGIGGGFIPKNLNTELLDGTLQINADEAKEFARRAAREEGLLIGISSGATLAAIAKHQEKLPAGATVLGFCYDTGERYLSIEEFLPESNIVER